MNGAVGLCLLQTFCRLVFTPDSFPDGMGQVNPTFILTLAVIRGIGEVDGPSYLFCLSVSLPHTFPRWFTEMMRIRTVLGKCSLVLHLVQKNSKRATLKHKKIPNRNTEELSVVSHQIYFFVLFLIYII